jgi:pimeloyl-ACP methyl ester carboxylesterase
VAENLILLHGALGSRAQMTGLRVLLSQDFTVYDFNFSGHGGEPGESPFSIDLFVGDTIAFMNAHQIQSASFFGYSMGGYVALKLAHDFPDRVHRVVTLGTKFQWDPGTAAKEVGMLNPEIVEQKVPAFATILAQRHQPGDWKVNMKKTADMMVDLGNGKAMTLQTLAEIPHPVMICVGTGDTMVTITESEFAAQHLKIGELNIIDGFKHPIEAIDQNVMARIITAFLER